jgi:hypothetical protein
MRYDRTLMNPEFLGASWDETEPVLVDETTLRLAESRILSCEACDPDHAEFPFDVVLDALTGSDPGNTDYDLAGPARCPRCNAEVRGKTLVEWKVVRRVRAAANE